MIRQKGAILLYNAPYAPDLIHIEFMFKAYKNYLNQFHKQFQLTPIIVHEGALNSISPEDGLRYFTKTTLTHLVEDHDLFQSETVIAAAAAATMLIATASLMILMDNEMKI